VFLDYIEKSANRECPGGLFGCTDKTTNDTRCEDRISYFLEKNALSNQTIINRVSLLTLFSIIFILSFDQIKSLCTFSIDFFSLTCHIQ
jgi:hypothetical protein